MGKRYGKKIRRKRKLTGYIYIPGSQYSEAEKYLKLRSCLHESVLYYYPRIVKYINKHEFYIQWTSRGLKDTNMSDIENALRVRNVMIVTPVLNK